MKKIFIILLAMSLPNFAQGLTIGSGTTFTAGRATITLTGNWNNSGIFTAGSSTIIFGGAGSDQTIAKSGGETFYNLTVNKSSNDVLLANDITVNNSLDILDGDLNLNGQTCYMGNNAELYEGDGNTVKGSTGTITATRILNAPNLLNVAGLGAVIKSSENLGETVIARGHAEQSQGANSGILRYYDITPANNSGLNATLAIYYDESELNGITESELCMFSSDDKGNTWNTQGGQCSTSDNIIEKTGIDHFSRWTGAGSTAPLPVELVAFEAVSEDIDVTLTWQTATEVDNYGFEIERQTIASESQKLGLSSDSDDGQALSGDNASYNWETIDFISGSGNSNSPSEYIFTDKPHGGSKFKYRLKQIDTDGKFSFSDIVEVEIIPKSFELFQNYPNPFNPVTTIEFTIPAVNNVKKGVDQRTYLLVYDILGRKVATLVDNQLEPGRYKIKFDAGNNASGMYIYRLVYGDNMNTKKMLLVK